MWLYRILLVLQFAWAVSADPQSFVVAPSDLSVIRGQPAILKCQVANKRGALQWTKDGFALGFDRQIPGFPRYKMGGSDDRGEYHLIIESVALEDDAEYQCQIGPSGGDPPLLGRAVLSVIMPPDMPVIEGYTNGSVVKVSHNEQMLNLTCIARNGKPAATFKWFRNGVELTEGVVIISSTEDLGNKLENGRSVLATTPRNEDNEALFTCQALSPALPRPNGVTVQLSVLHPPGPPEVTGYTSGQVVNTGNTMKLSCLSRGGNPLAQVYWYRNGEELDFSYSSGNNRAENELIFTVRPVDNNAIYQCQASNQMTREPLKAEVKLTVQFAPEKVTITGHQNAKAGETITLKCESAISNPPAVISWFSRGRPVTDGVSQSLPSPKGGFVTTSEIHVTLTDRENDVAYQCHGTNEALGQTVVEAITLKVMYPPEHPTIAGYTEGRSVYAGNVQSMTCTAVGGNPPATLKWMNGWRIVNGIALYYGERELEGVRRVTGNIVSSHVSFLLKPDDNNADYQCLASNPATIQPLVATVRLRVSFPPKYLNITLSPRVVQVGQRLSITCRSSSSNPASRLSWWKNGEEILGIDEGTVDAEFGGQAAISRLEMTPTVTDHGEIYACRATNVLLEQAVSDAVTLNVLYPPHFSSGSITRLDVIEGDWALLNLTALGNPANITYSWFFSGQRLILGKFKRDIPLLKFLQNGPILNLTDVMRSDAGTYLCEATNAEGNGNHSVTLNVLYPAEIVSTSSDQLIDQGSIAELECMVRANPIDVANVVTWSRVGFDMSRTSIEYDQGTTKLKIFSAQKEDSGEFVCTANNGIGVPATAVARLLVKYAPVIDKSPTYSKAAADSGRDAILICKAEGIPIVHFNWFKGSVELSSNRTPYTVAGTKKISLIHYESRLVIQNSSSADYGHYKCVAKNDLGEDSNFVSLDGISTPDVPYDLQFVNATHNSITLTWKPGFDGGAPQWFQVAYNPVDVDGKKYEDVLPHGSTVFSIKGLKLGTEYEITVKAINRLGHGLFQEISLRARTSAVAPITEDGPGDDIPLIIILTICAVGLLVLALNIILILFFIRRRKKKLEKDGSDSASQANTLEMFNAPVMVDDSNRSFTTFDHRSIDEFQDDFKAPFDVPDDVGRLYGPSGDPYYPGYYGHGPSPASGQVPFRPDYRRSGHPVGSDSQEGLNPDGVTNHPGWDGGYRGPYATTSLPREGDDYTEQLRKMQKNHLGQGGQRGSAHIPYAPSPPVRSSSKGAVDGLNGHGVPFRNYDPADDPNRYIPPSDSMYQSPRGQGSPAQLPPPPPELRGHLV